MANNQTNGNSRAEKRQLKLEAQRKQQLEAEKITALENACFLTLKSPLSNIFETGGNRYYLKDNKSLYSFWKTYCGKHYFTYDNLWIALSDRDRIFYTTDENISNILRTFIDESKAKDKAEAEANARAGIPENV
jgi:hypothetical protein